MSDNTELAVIKQWMAELPEMYQWEDFIINREAERLRALLQEIPRNCLDNRFGVV